MIPSVVLLESTRRQFPQEVNLSPAESALPRNTPITPLQSALAKSLDLKSFRIRTYKIRPGGGGSKLLTSSDRIGKGLTQRSLRLEHRVHGGFAAYSLNGRGWGTLLCFRA